MIKAGEFEIIVGLPYPCYVALKYKGEEAVSMTHRDLRDLRYVIDKAMREAKARLRDGSKHEV